MVRPAEDEHGRDGSDPTRPHTVRLRRPAPEPLRRRHGHAPESITMLRGQGRQPRPHAAAWR
jgi:hypothetical protein